MTDEVGRLTRCGSPLPGAVAVGTVHGVSARAVVTGMSPVWRQGMVALLDGDDIEVEVCENLEEWAPRQGGSCIVLGVGGDDDLDLLRAFHDDHSFTPVVAVSDDVSVSTFAHRNTLPLALDTSLTA